MKIVALLSLVFLLSGCIYQEVDIRDIKIAIKECGSLDNVLHIRAAALGTEQVTCVEGK